MQETFPLLMKKVEMLKERLLYCRISYDVRAYDEVTNHLLTENCRIIVPYLRGFGPTKFLSPDTIRSGQQSALANDLIALMDALSIQKAIVGGYDWGGRACCIASALFPRAYNRTCINGRI